MLNFPTPPKNPLGSRRKSEYASSNELAFISFFNVIKALIRKKKKSMGGGGGGVGERKREKN